MKLFKIFKKRTPKSDDLGDLEPRGFKVIDTKIPFNQMGAKQLPSSKLYTNFN